MLGFSAINLNTSSIVDGYSTVIDKRNDVIASVIANRRGNKDRVCGSAIGVGVGVFNTALFAAGYGIAKLFPSTQKFFPIKWAYDKIGKWILRAKQSNPTGSKFEHLVTGVISKAFLSIVTCALTGLVFDVYNNIKNKKLNGKFSNVKQGQQDDSWLLSGLKSLSATKHGKKIIRDSMRATDGGVVIKFKGIGKEYNITNKEINRVANEYVTLFDDEGKVKGYKKNYSSGDGDVLAFELAFKKYQSDLRLGKIKANPDLPKCANQFSSHDNLSETDVSQFYYLLTGKLPTEIKNNLFNIDEKSKLDVFIAKFANNSDNMSATFKFKDDGSGALSVKSIFNSDIKLYTSKVYSIKKINDKFVIFVDPRNTAVHIRMPIEEFKQKFGEIYSFDYN